MCGVNKKMKVQMYHHFRDEERKELIAEKEINSPTELKELANEINKEYPLPDGATWLWINTEIICLK